MARSSGTTIQNNLSKGLVTEATGLNFPENAVTDAENVIFHPVGKVTRRKGINIEQDAIALRYVGTAGVLKEFVWHTVGMQGGVTFLVLQIGETVKFYELTDNPALSTGIREGVEINLRDYIAPGASELGLLPASFAAGAGYLFIVHPRCEPVIVRWDREEGTFQSASFQVKIRDTKGIEDDLGINENPDDLSAEHHYNLKNQGWNKDVRAGRVNNESTGGSGIPNLFDPGNGFNWSNA